MSQVTLQGNASGTGVFTVAAPNSNTSRTLTLPDATGTVVTTDATQTLTNKSISGAQINSGTVAAARLGSGTPGTGNFLRGDGSWQSISVPSTAFDGVGSYAVAFYAANDPNTPNSNNSSFLARGATIAGSSLRVNSRATANNIVIGAGEIGVQGIWGNVRQQNDNNATFPTGNTTTLSGTWRLMLGGVWATNLNFTYFWRSEWKPLLWVRIS